MEICRGTLQPGPSMQVPQRCSQRGPERPREAQKASERHIKGFQKAPGCPKPNSCQFYQQLTYWEAAFLKGTNSRKKGFQKATGRPRPKSGQFYQQLTYWEAAFLKGPNSRKKASESPPPPEMPQRGPGRPREAQGGRNLSCAWLAGWLGAGWLAG